MKEDNYFLGALIGIAIVSAIISFGAAVQITAKGWERETVEQGCAEYSSQTGEWRWLEQISED